jgi:hypothetical protein
MIVPTATIWIQLKSGAMPRPVYVFLFLTVATGEGF